ncbi:hypothetical protein J6590_037292 [Homalodisca vitripennis]|nr:hypothetical protein J6590_037292 [Homalodisca vitripennis]
MSPAASDSDFDEDDDPDKIEVPDRSSHLVEATDSRSRRARIALLSEYAATLY